MGKQILKKINAILLILCLGIISSVAFAKNIKVEVSKNNLGLNETFTLSYTILDDLYSEPNFSSLENDFYIYGSSSRSSLQYSANQTIKLYSYDIVLKPRRAGKLTIPSIDFDGVPSPTKSIEVSGSGSDSAQSAGSSGVNSNTLIEPIVLKMQASKSKLHEAEELVLKVKLYFRQDILSGNMSEPKMNEDDFYFERIAEDKRDTQLLNKIPYDVIERTYLAYPKRAGKLDIGSVFFDGELRDYDAILSPTQYGIPVQKKSNSIQLDVEPKPMTPWLPAQNVSLEETWSDNIKNPDSNPIVRTIKLKVIGQSLQNLNSIADFGKGYPEDLSIYPEKPKSAEKLTPTGSVSTIEQRIVIIPKKQGSYLLPEIQIKWFDTKSKTNKIASLPKQNIKILNPALKSKNQQEMSENNLIQSDESLTESQLDAQNGVGSFFDLKFAFTKEYVGWILFGVIAGLWGGAVLKNRRPKMVDNKGPDSTKTSFSSSKMSVQDAYSTKILDACASNNAKECEKIFLSELRNRFPNLKIMNLKDASSHFEGMQKEAILALNESLYGRNSAPWDGMQFYNLMKNMQYSKSHFYSDESSLMSLYPSREDNA